MQIQDEIFGTLFGTGTVLVYAYNDCVVHKVGCGTIILPVEEDADDRVPTFTQRIAVLFILY